MSDTNEIGRAGDTYSVEISHALWFRAPGKPGRFVFAPESPEGLSLLPLDRAGTASFSAELKRFMVEGIKPTVGAWLVDDNGEIIFCIDADPSGFLASLADWARRHVPAIPALANLHTAAAARVALSLAQDQAIAALTPGALAPVQDAGLFEGLLKADAASVAAVIEAAVPGQRLWFWLSNRADPNRVPLLLQPVATDPNRERLDGQIAVLERRRTSDIDGATGFGFFDAQGRLQLNGRGMSLRHLADIADWVRREGDEFPALRRLAHCRLAETQGGRILRVDEASTLWDGIEPPPAPGTLAGAAAQLAALKPGDELRGWLTGATPDGAFIAFWSVADDPAAERFRAGTTGLYRRFAGSFADVVTGMLRRDASGELVFALDAGGRDDIADVFRRLAGLDAGLEPLAEARVEEA